MRTRAVFRYLESQFVDEFFAAGKLRLTSFAAFLAYEDEQAGDPHEGEPIRKPSSSPGPMVDWVRLMSPSPLVTASEVFQESTCCVALGVSNSRMYNRNYGSIHSIVRSPVKELHFPKELTVLFHLDGSSPKTTPSGTSGQDDLATIEKNGSEVITATVMLEDRMIEAVSKLLFGKAPDTCERREFFVAEIMGTSDFTFAFKRRVFTRLLEHTGALDTAAIKELKAGLNKLIEWRNAFAHGKVLHEHNGGYLLQYYRDGAQQLVLDDTFFENVESTVRNCLYACNGVIQAA